MAQNGRDAEQHQAGGIRLADLTVDAQEKLHVAAMRVRRQRRFADALAEGEKGVEAFGGGPRETVPFGHVLRVARRHVDPDGVGYVDRQG